VGRKTNPYLVAFPPAAKISGDRMKTNVAQTSLMSYMQLKDEAVLGVRQRAVFLFISCHPNCSDREVSKGTSLPINCTTARRNELVKMGFVKQDGVKYDVETNRYVSSWKICAH